MEVIESGLPEAHELRAWAEGTDRELRTIRGARLEGRSFCDASRSETHIVNQFGDLVLRQNDTRGAKRVGLDEITSCGEVVEVNLLDHIGPREHEDFIASIQELAIHPLCRRPNRLRQIRSIRQDKLVVA